MADKQATVYVIDLGSTMRHKHHGRSETDLEYALTYVWDKITATVCTPFAIPKRSWQKKKTNDNHERQVSNGRKTDVIGVVGFRTDGKVVGGAFCISERPAALTGVEIRNR
jgi:ATP-dependent DNA helicase 2 subunit 2